MVKILRKNSWHFRGVGTLGPFRARKSASNWRPPGPFLPRDINVTSSSLLLFPHFLPRTKRACRLSSKRYEMPLSLPQDVTGFLSASCALGASSLGVFLRKLARGRFYSPFALPFHLVTNLGTRKIKLLDKMSSMAIGEILQCNILQVVSADVQKNKWGSTLNSSPRNIFASIFVSPRPAPIVFG